MQPPEILNRRLYNTGLSQSSFGNAADVVSHLGAVQAQDFAAAKWALGLRIPNSTDQDIENAYNSGLVLRIHVMRPTWHFILPEDICWMTELTAPRLKASLIPGNRKIGLDEDLFSKSNQAIVKALQQHQYLTRQELKVVLDGIGIQTGVQTLAHILMRAELDGLICSGPRRGKQFTYALIEDRITNPLKLGRDQALNKLAKRYFTSHGPAQLEDFSWWSGLAMKEAQAALESLKPDLMSTAINNRTYWYFENQGIVPPDPPPALLLSIYDEYTLAYKDRRDISDNRDIERMILMGSTFNAVIIINGRLAGTWSKALKRSTVEIKLDPFRKLTAGEQTFLNAEIDRYSRFIGMPVVLVDSK